MPPFDDSHNILGSSRNCIDAVGDAAANHEPSTGEGAPYRGQMNAELDSPDGMDWLMTPRGLKADQFAIIFVLLITETPLPFVITTEVFERLCADMKMMTRRQVARACKAIVDKRHALSLAPEVLREARAFNSVPRALRAKIFARDKACRLCGVTSGLTIDHIKPRCAGGENVEENLQALCLPCNSKKASADKRAVAQ